MTFFNWIVSAGSGLIGLGILGVVIQRAVKINTEWENSIVMSFGKYKRTVDKAGLFILNPITETRLVLDIRTRTLEIEPQAVMTKDNISVQIDAVAFVKIKDPKKSVFNIRDLNKALKKHSQTSLRNVVGQVELDELLSKRDELAEKILKDVDKAADDWGVDVERIELQDIEIPQNMKRVMARQAEAEREKRGVIIASEGELIAAENLRRASDELAKSKYSYALRQLQTISDVSQDRSNTIIFAPSEALNAPILATGTAAKVPKPKPFKKAQG